MSEIPRIVTAEVVLHGVLKIGWDDGYQGIVDVRPVLKRGGMFDAMQSPSVFSAFKIGEFGHALIWLDDQGRAIDLGTDSLRTRAETQAELHRLAG